MALAWFIVSYKTAQDPKSGRYSRYCAVNDFTAQVNADGGSWEEAEIRKNRAIVKVVASATTLSAIAAAQGVKQIPLSLLTDNLSSLNNPRKNNLNSELLDEGFTQAEITAAFGNNFSKGTFADLLDFITSGTIPSPRFDKTVNQFFFDGEPIPMKQARDIDNRVK